jgi:hypothetical protein
MLIEALRQLESLGDLSGYTYYGFGGPYLDDFRILNDFFPNIRLVCIEEDEETHKRQLFHRPCGRITFEPKAFRSFLATYKPRDKKSIFWLDYTRFEFACFDEFISLLSQTAENSIVKVTLPASHSHFPKEIADFRAKFGAVIPADAPQAIPHRLEALADLVQKMLRVAVEKALPSAMSMVFQPVCSFCYTDGTGMLTLTGIVCDQDKQDEIRAVFRPWRFANLNWEKPRLIDVPVLSTKERLHLEKHLPQNGEDAGKILRIALGYRIDDSVEKTEFTLYQYAQYHRYAPYFVKVVP